MNLKKVVQDLHRGDDRTKFVALTLLLRLPDEQLLKSPDFLRQLKALADQGFQRSQGELNDLFGQFRDRLENLRFQELEKPPEEKVVDFSKLGRGSSEEQVELLLRIRRETLTQGRGEIRALLEVGAVDRVMAEAVATLGVVGEVQEDLPRLRKYLGHPSGRVRSEAVKAFSTLATPDGVLLTLGPALGDRHPRVRFHAIQAMARVGRDTILDRIEKLVGDERPEVRARAIPLLGYLRGPKITDFIRRLSSDQAESIRFDVVNICRAHGGEGVVSTLEWLGQDQNPKIKAHAGRTLKLIQAGRGQRPGLEISQLDSIPLDAPEREIPDFVDLDPRAQIQALMQIKRNGSTKNYPPVTRLLENDSNRPEVVASCLSALSVIGGREDIPRIRTFLAHSDGRVRANAVEAIDIMGGRREILTWLTPMLADPNGRVKKNVLVALGRFGEAVFVEHLKRMIASTHTQVRISGVMALAHYPSPAAGQLAQVVVQDKAPEVRMHFAEALSTRKDPWALELLQGLARSDMDYRVRDAAKVSLEAQGVAPPSLDGPQAGASTPAQAPASPQPAPAPSPAPAPTPAPTPVAAPAPSGNSGESEEPVYTMVDGLPMCPLPDQPPSSVQLSRGVAEQDGLGARIPDVGNVAQGFRPSVDIPRNLILGAAKAAQSKKAESQAPAETEAEVEAAEVAPESLEGTDELVLETVAPAQDGAEEESMQDTLGKTFMNFAALIGPGNESSMKKMQALEKDHSAALEKLGRQLFDRINRKEIEHKAFERTLYVLKKYQHSRKSTKKGDAKEEKKNTGLFGMIFGGGAQTEEDPPQLRAQYRNLAKECVALFNKGEVKVTGLDGLFKEVNRIDAEMDKVSQVD